MTVSRDLVITYGTYVIDGTSTAVDLDGDPPYRMSEDHEVGTCEFDIIASGSTYANMVTAVTAALAAFRTPRQDFSVVLDGNTIITWSQSANTGFDADPDIRKVGDPFDGGLSQRLRCSVSVGLPADKASLNGRRSSDISIGYAGSRRRQVNISGAYTAITSNTALEQYDSLIATYAASVLAGLGGTYKLLNEVTPYFETNKVVRFEREYEEIVAGQSSAQVRGQQTKIVIRRLSPGDSPDVDDEDSDEVLRLVEVTASLTAAIDKDLSTDLTSQIESARAYLIGRVEAKVDADGLGLISDEATIDEDNNEIQIVQVYEAALGLGWSSLEREETTDHDKARQLIKTWSSTPFHRYEYFAPEDVFLVVRETGTWAGEFDNTPSLEAVIEPITPLPEGAEEWKYMSKSQPMTRAVQGLDGSQREMWQVTRIHRFEAATVITPAGA